MNLTAIILAGGKSSRMGEDKGLMLFKGKAMIQHVIDAVKPFVNTIIIISNNKKYEEFGYVVYKDLLKNKGPLAGIYTGLHHSQTKKNLVLSCDVPLVNSVVFKLLIDNCEGIDVIIPKKEERMHPLIGLYDKSCIKVFSNELENNRLKLKLAIEKLKFNIIDANFINDNIFRNINSKNDIEA